MPEFVYMKIDTLSTVKRKLPQKNSYLRGSRNIGTFR